ncbi:MAG: type II toxin-antitoxin system HicA family toxin [Oscillospiraceae bacterium]|nr:type II toxin-antitoxin system HicA family toxin [Oscillospiraceae bacterium]
MSKYDKLLYDILSGRKDSSISFSDLCKVLTLLGFSVRIKGDHFIYFKDGIDEIINIQPKGNSAKAYQVKQVRNIILKYRLGGIDDV